MATRGVTVLYTAVLLVFFWRVSQPPPLLLQEWASMQGRVRLTGLAAAIALVCTVATAASNGWVGVALTLAPPPPGCKPVGRPAPHHGVGQEADCSS